MQVFAEVQGDLLGNRGLLDLSTKNLLVPSLRAWHEDYVPQEYEVLWNIIMIIIIILLLCSQNGPSDWLLVDEYLVDLSGRECNKVGLDFTAFRNQPGKCYQLPDS